MSRDDDFGGFLHIQVRLVSLLVFAILLPFLPPAGLLVASLVIVVLLLRAGCEGIAIVRGIRRIRWLLLSLAVLYLFFTPGPPLIEALGAFSPSRIGIERFVERGAVLILMLCAALLVVRPTPVAMLGLGMQRLLGPLCRLRILPARFPLRLGMVFSALDTIEPRVRAQRMAEGSFAERATALWCDIEQSAIAENDSTIAEPELPPVPAWQWLVPLFIFLSAFGLAVIGE